MLMLGLGLMALEAAVLRGGASFDVDVIMIVRNRNLLCGQLVTAVFERVEVVDGVHRRAPRIFMTRQRLATQRVGSS